MKKTVISLVLLTGLFFNAFSQQSMLNEGWSAFEESNYKLAIVKFEQAATNASTKSEANLALSIIYHTESKEQKSFDHFKAFYESSKNPKNELYALWKTASVSDGRGKLTEDRLDFFLNLNFDGDDGMYKAVNNEFLNNHYLMANNLGKSRDYANQVGVVNKWAGLGIFDNVSASGFGKTHDALENPQSSKIFTNKNGGEVQWFDIPYLPISNWLATTHYFVNNNSVIYAQTFCESEKAQKAQVRVGAYGSFRLWVNDVLVMEEEEEQITDIDAYTVTVNLNQGNNRILVQMGCSELSNSGVFVRLTDNNGNPLDNVSYSTEYNPYNKGKNETPIIKKLPIEEHFEKEIASKPDEILNYILLYYTYAHNGKTQKKLELMRKASAKFPKNTLIKTFLISVYSRLDNETDESKELEALKEMAPNSYKALNLTYDDKIEKEEYEEAEETLDKIKDFYGENFTTTLYGIQLASLREQHGELNDLIKTAYKKYPESWYTTYLRYLVYKDKNKSRKGIKIVKKYLKKNFSSKLYETLASAYFQSGNPNAGLAIYKKLANQFPEESDFSYTLGQIYSSVQQYETAEDYFRTCLKVAPYAPGYFEKIAECYEEMDKDELAIKYYNKVIEYGRYDFDAREKVRVLNGEEKLFEQFAEVKDPEDIFENSPIAKDLPEENSVMLLDQTHKIVHEDGATESRRYLMVKVLNATGVDNWKEYSVGSGGRATIEEAMVYKADGSKVEADKNYSYIVFTGLEEGDAIYIEYKNESTNYGKLAKHFWAQHYFDYFIPSVTNNYSLLVHKSKKFKYEVTNGTIEPKVSDKGDYKLYEWNTKDNKGIKSESYMPSLVDVTPTLHLSSIEEWNEIVDWYIDLSQTKQKSDVVLKETIEELFEGKENLTDKQKAQLIYDYITKNIRYSSISFRQSGLVPQKASKVISTKLGDCKDVSTLFVTMCREVGLDANLVLVNTRDNGDKDVYLPSIDFNHCIAKVNLDNKPYFIELTSDLIPFSTQGYNLRYATVLDISKGNNNIQHLDVDTRLKNSIKRETTLSFKGDDMIVKKRSIKTGDYSGNMRAIYRDIGSEKQFKRMQEAVSGTYVKTKLTNLDFNETLDSNVEAIEYGYDYLVEDVFNDVGGILIFKLPWADNAEHEDFLSAESRKLPISIWKYTVADSKYEKITVNLPSDKKLVKSKPDDIVINNEFFSYSLTHKKVGKQLIIIRKFNFKKDTIEVKDYEKFKNEYEKVIKADTRQLAFNA